MKDVKGIFGFKPTREQNFTSPNRQSIEKTEDYAVKKSVITKELKLSDGSNSGFVMNDTNGNLSGGHQIVTSNPIYIPTLQYLIPNNQEPFLQGGTIIGISNNTDWKFLIYVLPQVRTVGANSFTDYNPVIELMRYKRINRRKFGGVKVNYKNVFVHPTHQNGLYSQGKNYNSGSQRDNVGSTMPDRNTEWSFTATDDEVFKKVEIIFSLSEWKGVGTDLLSTYGTNPLPCSVSDWENHVSQYSRSTGFTKSKNHKTDVFSFRLRIDNPDNTDTRRPYLYGDLSQPFKVYPKLGKVGGVMIFYGWKVTRCQYAKNR